MGTCFQMITRQKGSELQILKFLGYDVITIGNHELDFGVKGLVQMIRSAIREVGPLPPIVASNMAPSEHDYRDEDLRQLVREGIIKPYVVIERQNMRFGFMGLIGKDAIDVTRNHAPVKFLDPIKTAKKIAQILRTQEKADVIIALSHSEITRTTLDDAELSCAGNDGNWVGEDVDLAQAVPEIDIVISGHTHIALKEPITIGKTTIVQALCANEPETRSPIVFTVESG